MGCETVGPKKPDERKESGTMVKKKNRRRYEENKEGSEHIGEGKTRRNQIKTKG